MLSQAVYGSGESETVSKWPSPPVASPSAFVLGWHRSLLADAEAQ